MRDLSRSSGMSLAGLYHYFESKERLLYLIQKHTFSTIVDQLRERLDEVSDPEQRIRVFIVNHLEYFLANREAMKVLSHEADVLKNGFAAEIAAIKREYFRICVRLLDDFKVAKGIEFSSRTAVLSLFGMMNWIYTWYNPRIDGDAGQRPELRRSSHEVAQDRRDIGAAIGAHSEKGGRRNRPMGRIDDHPHRGKRQPVCGGDPRHDVRFHVDRSGPGRSVQLPLLRRLSDRRVDADDRSVDRIVDHVEKAA